MGVDRSPDVARVRFGTFILDVARRGLYRDGQRVHLTSKPLETLIYLVTHAGRTVEKQELLDAVWKDTAVTEDTLVQAVREIRRALGDDKTDPHFIQTVPRQGYRFVSLVTRVDEPPEVVTGQPAWVEEQPARPVPPARVPRSRWWGMLGVAAVVVAVPLSVWLIRRNAVSEAPPPPMRKLQQLTPEGLNAGKPALSRQGNLLYNAGGALHIRVAEGDTSLRITDRILPSGDIPVFTADGGRVVFSLPRNGDDGSRLYDLFEVGAIGGPPRPFIREASGAGFSPDGRWVAYTKHLNGQAPLWISPIDRLDRHVEVRARGFVPRWSPDGRAIAYTTADPNAGAGELWIARIASPAAGTIHVTEHIRLTSEPQAMYGLNWTPDSRSLVYAGRRPGGATHLFQLDIEGGEPKALTSGAGDYVCPSVTADGKSVVFWHGTPIKNLAFFERLGDEVGRELTEDEYHLWPVLSPSGTRVASIVRRPDYDEHLYVTDVATGKRVSLTSRPARHPAWIDDENIAYLEDAAGGGTLVRLASVTSGVAPLELTAFPGKAEWVAVHPGRRMLAVVLAIEGNQRVVVRRLDGQGPDRTVAEGAEYTHLHWLPDGSRLSWSGPERSSADTSNGIWVINADGTGLRRMIADGYGPVWAPDGQTVYFSRIRDRAGLWMFDVLRGTEAPVRTWTEGNYEFDVASERLVLTREEGRGRIYAMSLDPRE